MVLCDDQYKLISVDGGQHWRLFDLIQDPAEAKDALVDPHRAYVSRYALGRDYHKVLRRRLARLAQRIDRAAGTVDGRYRAFTDSAPVLEKALGEKAGLGWIGKHSLLLNRDAGNLVPGLAIRAAA